MTYPKAIVCSAALIAAAIAFSNHQPAQGAFGGDGGRYVLVAASQSNTAWIVDNETGKIVYCVPSQATCHSKGNVNK